MMRKCLILFLAVSMLTSCLPEDKVEPAENKTETSTGTRDLPPGEITFDLTWDDPEVDFNLQVATPSNLVVYFFKKKAAGGSFLKECGCINPCSGTSKETIKFQKDADPGEYRVKILYINHCEVEQPIDSPDASFTLTVSVDGKEVSTETRTSSRADRSSEIVIAYQK